MCDRRGFYLVKCDVNNNVLHASDCNDEGSSHNAQRCDSNVKFGKIMTQHLMEERAKSSPDEPMKQVYYSIKSETLRNREENKDIPSRSINDFPSFNSVAKKLYEIRNSFYDIIIKRYYKIRKNTCCLHQNPKDLLFWILH